MAAPPLHLTKSELAVQVLRERIRSGELAPGARLRVEQLARELEMSPTPIREALRILQADRLVNYRPHYGIVVAEFSDAQIHEIYRVRALLEPFAVELAVPLLDDQQLSELERLHEQHATAVQSDQASVIGHLNSAWHWMIYEASGSPLLNSLIHGLWEASPWRTMWALPGLRELSHREHASVMEAIGLRDAARAAEAMRVHVDSGEAMLLARLEGEVAAPSRPSLRVGEKADT